MTARSSGRTTKVAIVIACTLLGCAGRSESSVELEPKLGHSQPLSPSAAPDAAQPISPADPVQQDPPASDTNPSAVASEPEPTEPEPTEPEAAPSIPPPAAVIEEDEELCSHITSVVLSESGNAAGLTADQIDELIASCSLTLAQDRRQLGKAEYRKRANCVRKASSVKAIAACKPE